MQIFKRADLPHITDGHHVKAEQQSSASVIIKEKPVPGTAVYQQHIVSSSSNSHEALIVTSTSSTALHSCLSSGNSILIGCRVNASTCLPLNLAHLTSLPTVHRPSVDTRSHAQSKPLPVRTLKDTAFKKQKRSRENSWDLLQNSDSVFHRAMRLT